MKVLKSQVAICTNIQVVGSVAHAVHFHEAVEDTQRAVKPQWAFVIPGMNIAFKLGQQYCIQVCDPAQPSEGQK